MKYYFDTYLKKPEQAKKVVSNAQLVALAHPEEFGWTIQQLKSVNGVLDERVLRELKDHTVRLFLDTKLLASGEVMGGEIKGDMLGIRYRVTEVYKN